MKPNITSGHCHHLSAVTGGRLNLDASQSRSTTTRQAAVCRIVKDGEEMEQRALEHNDVHSSELADQGLGVASSPTTRPATSHATVSLGVESTEGSVSRMATADRQLNRTKTAPVRFRNRGRLRHFAGVTWRPTAPGNRAGPGSRRGCSAAPASARRCSSPASPG